MGLAVLALVVVVSIATAIVGLIGVRRRGRMISPTAAAAAATLKIATATASSATAEATTSSLALEAPTASAASPTALA